MLLVGLACSVGACSTTSTITRIHEPPVEADIVGGSPQSIFIVSETGEQFEIPRKDISDVDYPGNVHAVVGGGVLGYGVFNILAGFDDCQRSSRYQAAYCVGVFTPALVGAALIVWGIAVHQDEESAFGDMSHGSRLPRARKRAPRAVAPLPVELPEDPPPAPPPGEPSPDESSPAASSPPAASPAPEGAPIPASPSATPPAAPAPGSVPTQGFPVD